MVIRIEGISKYLERRWNKEMKRWNRVVKFRIGNVMRERLYWEEEKKNVGCASRRKRRMSMYGKDVQDGEKESWKVGRERLAECWGRRERERNE